MSHLFIFQDVISIDYCKTKIMIGFSRKSWKNSKIFDRRKLIKMKDRGKYLYLIISGIFEFFFLVVHLILMMMMMMYLVVLNVLLNDVIMLKNLDQH